VRATFEGSDREISNFVVGTLETPAGTLKSAILRVGDIDVVEFDVDDVRKKFNIQEA
jgi:hypothetical protein